jgi:hypothetical protein
MSRKQVIWGLIIVLALIILGAKINKVEAAPMQYFGTPIYYSKFTPNEFDCVYAKDASFGFCADARYYEEATIGYTKATDPEKGEGVPVRLFTEVVCLDTICASNYNEPYGSSAERGVTYWYVPVGFYMDASTGKTRVYKHGTGPRAEYFLMKGIKLIPGYQDPPVGKMQKDTPNRYDVYCNKADECSYMGRIILASQLRNYIPSVLTHNCSGWFCYNPDNTIAGLNPRA